MMAKIRSKINLKKTVFGWFFAILLGVIGTFSPIMDTVNVNAIPEEEQSEQIRVTADDLDNEPVTEEPGTEEPTSDETTEGGNSSDETSENEQESVLTVSSKQLEDNCQNSLGSIGWLVCPTTGKVAEAVDWLYEKIEGILAIDPIPTEDGSPYYEIWKYCRGLTNIVFIIFLLVVIYSQITGYGISNYGLKKVLPKVIVTAIMVNLSFLICSLAVDVSNIVGSGLREAFTAVEESVIASQMTDAVPAGDLAEATKVTYSQMYSSLTGGASIAIGGGVIAFESGAIWMLIPVVLGALVSVVSGLITIALRQTVVALLIMISPLAIVAYMLPNTENLFKKWKNLLYRMLVFYPMFSLLFGASSLAGFAIVMGAKDGFGLLLGTAVQIFPLFFSWSLMKMSGTFLGTINAKMHSLMAGPLATNRAWADSHRQVTRQKYLAARNAYTPSLRLRQFLSDRKTSRETEIAEASELVKNRGLAYNARRHYRRDNTISREGEQAYEMQARNAQYNEIVKRDKVNFEMGLGVLPGAARNAEQRARLNALDKLNVEAFDRLHAQEARGERVMYENAMYRHKRMEDAVNAHFDDLNAGNSKYKAHDLEDRNEARARYNAMLQIMDGNAQNVQYIAASAAQAYDTQKKIVEAKMGKYFEYTPPTKDVEYRLEELTKARNAAFNIDSIIAGMRVLNQRGDTDLVKAQLDNILDKEIGGGIKLGTHASQALASFLMFEVKDNDPYLRRFGKYINLETANAFNKNNRKVMDVTYDEYIKGYHDGELDLITTDNPAGRMFAKKGMKQLVEGTSLDNVERTAFSNLDESLKKAYGFDKRNTNKEWDVAGYLKKREEIQTAFEPAFLSASLKWLSGSEQINSGVRFWTGYGLTPKKDEHDKVILDDNGDPVYDLEPEWKKKEFQGHEEEVEKYYRRKTHDYFKDQTTGQILGMRTDYRDPTMEHLMAEYFENNPEGQKEFEARKAEIQTRYADEEADKAKKMRSKDLKDLKMEMAGRQLREILGKTGKLKQIYRTRTNGTAINAKDWLRRWVNLDDEDALRREVVYYDDLKKAKKKVSESGADTEDDSEDDGRIYTEEDRENFLNILQDMKDRELEEESEIFFEDTKSQLEKWFGKEAFIVKKYEEYYRKDNPYADNIELYKYLKELIGNMDNYPDAK